MGFCRTVWAQAVLTGLCVVQIAVAPAQARQAVGERIAQAAPKQSSPTEKRLGPGGRPGVPPGAQFSPAARSAKPAQSGAPSQPSAGGKAPAPRRNLKSIYGDIVIYK